MALRTHRANWTASTTTLLVCALVERWSRAKWRFVELSGGLFSQLCCVCNVQYAALTRQSALTTSVSIQIRRFADSKSNNNRRKNSNKKGWCHRGVCPSPAATTAENSDFQFKKSICMLCVQCSAVCVDLSRTFCRYHSMCAWMECATVWIDANANMKWLWMNGMCCELRQIW